MATTYQHPVPTSIERPPDAAQATVRASRIYIVRDAATCRYLLASSQADGTAAYAVLDPTTGAYRLNDAPAGARPLTYFSAANRAVL